MTKQVFSTPVSKESAPVGWKTRETEKNTISLSSFVGEPAFDTYLRKGSGGSRWRGSRVIAKNEDAEIYFRNSRWYRETFALRRFFPTRGFLFYGEKTR